MTHHYSASLACQPGSQILEGAKLQLLDRALAPAHLIRNIAYRLFFGESHDDHASLISHKSFDQLEQTRPAFTLFQFDLLSLFGQLRVSSHLSLSVKGGRVPLPCLSLRPISNQV